GSLGYFLIYLNETTSHVTGHEVPPSRTVAYLDASNSGGVRLEGGDLTVTGTLRLGSGALVTGPQVLIMAPGANVSRLLGMVLGNLRKDVATGGSVTRTFELGESGGYTPVVLTF